MCPHCLPFNTVVITFDSAGVIMPVVMDVDWPVIVALLFWRVPITILPVVCVTPHRVVLLILFPVGVERRYLTAELPGVDTPIATL